MRIIFLAIFTLTYSVTWAGPAPKVKASKRAPTSFTIVTTTRTTSIGSAFSAGSSPQISKLSEPCRADNECAGGLSCHEGYCIGVDQFNRGEVGDTCSSDVNGGSECLSGICRQNACAPSNTNRADNLASCILPSDCRSRLCQSGYCEPSSSFKGLPTYQCNRPGDCVSNTCIEDDQGSKACGFSSRQASACAALWAVATIASECCSNSLVNGVCAPVASPECTRGRDCKGKVGKICAVNGDSVINDSQCCSGKRIGNRCVFSTSSFACASDRDCRSGYCDLRVNLCRGGADGPRDSYRGSVKIE